MSDAAPLVEELVPTPDPLETGARFADLPLLVLLDSAADHERLGRYAFLAADPYTAVRAKGLLTQQLHDDHWNRVEGDPLARVRALLEPFRTESVAGLPPFQGGAAGYIGYDWGATLERVPRARYDDLAVPDLLLGLYDWLIAWDHQMKRAWVISTGMPEQGPARDTRATRRLAFVKERLADGRTTAIDYREIAPASVTRNMYLRPDGSQDPKASLEGIRAAGVPGTVAGFALALEKYGTMKWADVVEPARRLAGGRGARERDRDPRQPAQGSGASPRCACGRAQGS